MVMAAGAFALVASSVYILNDLGDRERDHLHSRKRLRPLAAGTISPAEALSLMGVLMVGGLALGYWVSSRTFMFLSTYIILNALYTKWLKRIVILDVFRSGSVLGVRASFALFTFCDCFQTYSVGSTRVNLTLEIAHPETLSGLCPVNF